MWTGVVREWKPKYKEERRTSGIMSSQAEEMLGFVCCLFNQTHKSAFISVLYEITLQTIRHMKISISLWVNLMLAYCL